MIETAIMVITVASFAAQLEQHTGHQIDLAPAYGAQVLTQQDVVWLCAPYMKVSTSRPDEPFTAEQVDQFFEVFGPVLRGEMPLGFSKGKGKKKAYGKRKRLMTPSEP